MYTFFAFVLICTFLSIGVLHLYWAVGGKKWIDIALPQTGTGQLLFKPGAVETIIVALGLFAFAGIIGTKAHFISLPLWNEIYLSYATAVIGFLFLIRSIGEFRYVSFFKKIKHTDFGKMDTLYYSPVCFIIAVMCLIILVL